MIMMDMTMRSSIRVKPESDSRYEARGSRGEKPGARGKVRAVFFMSYRYLNRLTAIEYRRFALADSTDVGDTLSFI